MNIRKSILGLATMAAMASAAPADAAANGPLLPVAKQDYPYSGYYAATRGDDCIEDRQLTKDDAAMVVAPRVENGLTYYYAIPLQVDLKTADGEAHRVQADGSLKGFVKDSADVMGIKIIYEIRVLLKPLDADHILAREWTVTYVDKNGQIKDVIDMTKADGGNHDGKEHRNLLDLQPGGNGVCLKRVGDLPG